MLIRAGRATSMRSPQSQTNVISLCRDCGAERSPRPTDRVQAARVLAIRRHWDCKEQRDRSPSVRIADWNRRDLCVISV